MQYDQACSYICKHGNKNHAHKTAAHLNGSTHIRSPNTGSVASRHSLVAGRSQTRIAGRNRNRTSTGYSSDQTSSAYSTGSNSSCSSIEDRSGNSLIFGFEVYTSPKICQRSKFASKSYEEVNGYFGEGYEDRVYKSPQVCAHRRIKSQTYDIDPGNALHIRTQAQNHSDNCLKINTKNKTEIKSGANGFPPGVVNSNGHAFNPNRGDHINGHRSNSPRHNSPEGDNKVPASLNQDKPSAPNPVHETPQSRCSVPVNSQKETVDVGCYANGGSPSNHCCLGDESRSRCHRDSRQARLSQGAALAAKNGLVATPNKKVRDRGWI